MCRMGEYRFHLGMQISKEGSLKVCVLLVYRMNSSRADNRVNCLRTSDVSETHFVSVVTESGPCKLFKTTDVSETHSVSILRESGPCQLFKTDVSEMHPVSIQRESGPCQFLKTTDVSETHSVCILRESGPCKLFKNHRLFRDTLHVHPQGDHFY
jgi:hypothetical protein